MLSSLSSLQNLDLFTVGIAVAGMTILGFVTLFNNLKSASNRALFYLTVTASVWGIVNYAVYQVSSINLSFWLLRLVMFFGVWSSFFVFTLLYIFPSEKMKLSNSYKWFLVPLTIITASLTLTPFVFSKIAAVTADEQISRVVNGPGIFLFSILVMFLNIGGISILVQKIMKADKEQRRSLQIVLFGFVLMSSLILAFNFILPAFFDISRFVSWGAVFLFPFITLTSYAILKHHLLDVKVIATETLTFILAIVSFLEVIFSEGIAQIGFRSGVFLLVLGFGILLIRSVRKEVEQRERLEKLTKDLQSANDRLIELDRLRAEFLSFATHQVKSPMAVVKGYATIIADGTLGQVSGEVRATAEKIKGAADRLILLVNNLLDMRKIEEGKLDFKFEEKDFVAFLRGMVEEYQLIAKEKKLQLLFEPAVSSITIKFDEEKIRQVIQNLLDNSLKYTSHGYVKVAVREEQNATGQPSVLVTIEDSGMGMSKELQQKLFGRFVRDEQTKHEIQGTGLGLFIAKQIVEAHHGSIWAESDGVGKGSKFNVRLGKI